MMAGIVAWAVLAAQIGNEVEAPAPLETITVSERRAERADEPPPILVYEAEYFDHFEPLSLGDMLRRVPGVAFSGDVGEFGAPQLRGLPGQYTRVLINGRQLPGNGADRSVRADRIPAELVERIEIVRSPSPTQDAEGIAGAINVVLRDGAARAGGSWRLGAYHFGGGGSTLRGAGTLQYSGAHRLGGYFLSGHVQQREAPRSKLETVIHDDGELAGRSLARDHEQSTDYSASTSYEAELGDARRLGLHAAWARTDNSERERLRFFDAAGELEAMRRERTDNQERRADLRVDYVQALGHGRELEVGGSFSRLSDQSLVVESLVEGNVEEPELIDHSRARGEVGQLAAGWRTNRADGTLTLGADLARETRDARQRLSELDDGELADVTPGNGVYQVEETQLALYAERTRSLGPATRAVYGARLELVDLEQVGIGGRATDTDLQLNPSLHLLQGFGESNRLRFSLARTLRRPRFDEIIPFETRDAPGEDQVTVGNPGLEPETAWGMDLGYDHRLGDGGMAGINLFYRDIDDRIELVRVGDNRFTPRNVADGKVWGVEIDLAVTLTWLGLPRITVQGNYSRLESEIADSLSGQHRRFNLQPAYVANIALIHALEGDARWGLSYQTRGRAIDVQPLERAELEYDGNLELFVETEWRDLTVRLGVNNLLDAVKTERTATYETLAAQRAGNFEELATEREQTDPVWVVTLRGSF